jgi:hypothetical protein
VVADTVPCGGSGLQAAGQATPAATPTPAARDSLPRLRLTTAARHARRALARRFRGARVRRLVCHHTVRSAATCRVTLRWRGRTYSGRVRVRWRATKSGAVLRSAVVVSRRRA